MPTQRHEKRVEKRKRERERKKEKECTHVGERETHKEREREGGREREKESTHVGERERKQFGSSLYMFFLTLGLPYVNWAWPGVLFVLPEVFTPVLRLSFDLPLFYCCGLFPSLSFSYCQFGLLFPILTT